MSLENISLTRETSHKRPFIWNVQNYYSHTTLNMHDLVWNVQNWQNYRDRLWVSDLLGLWRSGGKWGETAKGFFGGWWKHFNIDYGMVADFCEYTKSHWIVHFKKGELFGMLNISQKELIVTQEWMGQY